MRSEVCFPRVDERLTLPTLFATINCDSRFRGTVAWRGGGWKAYLALLKLLTIEDDGPEPPQAIRR
jgi:hypothetical protein